MYGHENMQADDMLYGVDPGEIWMGWDGMGLNEWRAGVGG